MEHSNLSLIDNFFRGISHDISFIVGVFIFCWKDKDIYVLPQQEFLRLERIKPGVLIDLI